MNQVFVSDCRRRLSGGLLEDNWLFYMEFTIANAARSQFDYDRDKQRLTESPIDGMMVIEGRGR